MTTRTELNELTGDYALDADRTRIGFVARHRMATRVRGQFERFEGSAYLNGDDPSKSHVQVTIHTASIQTRNRQRDDLLRRKFLGVDAHPTMTFTSTRVEHAGGTTFRVTGDLAIRGVTKPVTLQFDLADTERDADGTFRIGLDGSATIDRNDWGVNWNAATSIGISEKVILDLDVSAIQRSGPVS